MNEPEPQAEQKKELIKHSAAIQIQNNITLLQRRAWNVLLYHAYNALLDEETHCMRVQELMRVLEFDSKNEEYLKEALRALVNCTVEWNILDKDGRHEWGVAALLAQAVIKNGLCMYAYAPVIRQRLHNPNMYAKLDLSLQNRFLSKHTQALWELCTDYLGAAREYGETPFISVETFRKIMGIAEGMYPAFMNLNQKVLKPALAEMNQISNFHVHADYQRVSRGKVVALKFKMSRSPLLPGAPHYQPSLFPDLDDMPLVVKILKDAGLAAQDSWEISQSGFAYVGAKYRPALHGEEPAEAFVRYVQEKVHLLKQRQQLDKVSSPTGFLLAAIKKNYSNATFEQEAALEAKRRRARELKTLQAKAEKIQREQTAAVETLSAKVIDALPLLLEQAVEAARQEKNNVFDFCYKPDKTPKENFQHPAVAGVVGKWLETKFPEQYAEARAPFLRQLAELNARIAALTAETTKAAAPAL